MKGAVVYNTVQAMIAQGRSQRRISLELGINRRTVKKLSGKSISEASAYFQRGVVRRSGYDVAREFIEAKLMACNDLRSSNLYHQVREHYPDLALSERAFRDYVRKLKSTLNLPIARQRYFEPVTDWQAGEYMQVDPGEKSVVILDGTLMKVYFVSFVLCYSRQMYVHYSSKAYNTELFIDAHLRAFQSFGGIPRKGLYDQTKLVAISESYREVIYNERFQQFFLSLGFQSEVCEGYDPQSKGMVEKSIDYIKGSFIHGREFSGIEDVRSQSDHWLSTVANVREHQTTQRRPSDLLLEEQQSMLPLGVGIYASEQRQVDKTGLISYHGRSYSVPFRFQGRFIQIRNIENTLFIIDPVTGELLAEWDITKHREKINKNGNHYVDYRQSIADELNRSKTALEELSIPQSELLLQRLSEDNSKHPRAQYRGLRKLLRQYETKLWEAAIDDILSLPVVSYSRVRKLLLLKQQQSEQGNVRKQVPPSQASTITRNRFRGLEYYNRLVSGAQYD